VAIAIVPFLSPPWIAFEQDRSNAEGRTGYTQAEVRDATEPIVHDLVFGGAYAVQVNGLPVLDERERVHMNDVRTVFRGLWLLAALSAVVLLIASRRTDRARTWRAVRGGALGLIVGTVVVGVVGLVAFDQLFETFHEVFFPAGSFLFDPATDKLVQLFPFEFWDETALVVGVVIIAAALAVAWAAARRARRSTATRPAHDLAIAPEPGS
jgi:integral membrane protein (TIGR01906 family)